MHPLQSNSIESKAILLHTDNRQRRVDVTVHDVIHLTTEEGSNISQLGAGRVLGLEEKAEMGCILNDTVAAKLTLFDEHILTANSYAIAWWMPAAKRQLMFKVSDGQSGVERVEVEVDFPSHVGVFCRGELYFAATKANKARPKGTTQLFNSPLPNLYSGGRFCQGTAGKNIPREANPNSIPGFEAFLFDTVNTHVGSGKPLQNINTTEALVRLYQREKRVPRDRLVPMNTTLQEWMTAIDVKRVGR